jgi:hypothetical protein
MKRILISILFFAISTIALAQQSCPAPDQKVVVFFGNEINANPEDADSSLRLLKAAIGTTYNGQTIRYDLAYNKTSGIPFDLGQSAMQAGIQWDSQLVGWLNGIGVAPDWFAAWYRTYTLAATTVVGPELADHVQSYSNAILFGQKVVVVAHSQGNFYVNEAKKLLALDITPEQMKSFAIYSVANPANNVGGAPVPYITNDRDFIWRIPTALPANWTLRKAAGAVADSIGLVQAHLFNTTYISSDYDTKPTLLAGIKAQIDSLKAPPPNCENYRKYYIGLLAGNYTGRCDQSKTPQTVAITKDAQMILPALAADLSQTEIGVAIGSTIIPRTPAEAPGVSLLAGNQPGTLVAKAQWTNNIFSSALIGLNNVGSLCIPDKSDTVTSLAAPVDLAKATTNLLINYRTTFPKGRCFGPGIGPPSSLADYVSKDRRPVTFSDLAITVGNNVYDLSKERAAESIGLLAPAPAEVGFEPIILLKINYLNGDAIELQYKKFKGLVSFSYGNAQSGISCVR